MRELKLPYPAGSVIVATVFSPDGDRVWTSTGFQNRPATALAIATIDTGNVGLYVGDFPTGITAAGVYPIVYHTAAGTLAGTQVIRWSGSRADETPTITVVSLSDVDAGNEYFDTRLYAEAWTTASSDDKQKALNDATRIINRLRYLGYKTVNSQANEWPRKGLWLESVELDSAVIPQDILFAQYEIAFALLSGVDVEKEWKSLSVTSRGYSSVRITYDAGRSSEWLLYGIPSGVAWSYLLAYLDRNSADGIILHRV